MSAAAPQTVAAPVVTASAPSAVLDDIAQRTMNALNPIVGDYDQRTRAFKDIAANVAQSGIGLNGWQTMPQILTACWLADGLQVHPTVFMRGNWLFNVMGRNVVEPRWQFIVGLMRARLPGFRMKVVEKSEATATVWMTNGVDEHEETYTQADAERQGLWTKKGGTYQTNNKELLFKQAVKRAGDIVGGHVLMGLPDRDDDQAVQVEASPAPAASPAAVLEAAAPPVEINQVRRCADILARVWHLDKKDLRGKLDKAALVMTAIRGLPIKYEQVEHLGPSDAREIADFLEAKYGATGSEAGVTVAPATSSATGEPGASAPSIPPTAAPEAAPESDGGGAPDGSEGTDAPADPKVTVLGKVVMCRFPDCQNEATLIRPSTGATCDEHHPADEDAVPDPDEPPPAEAPEPEPSDIERQGLDHMHEQDGKVARIFEMAVAAEKSHKGTVFVKEAPHKSGKWWFVHAPILATMGQPNSFKIRDNGEQSIDAEMCRTVVRRMRENGIALPGEPMPRMDNRKGGSR